MIDEVDRSSRGRFGDGDGGEGLLEIVVACVVILDCRLWVCEGEVEGGS